MISSYPPTHIHTTDNIVNVLQLTDLHLYTDPKKTVEGRNCQADFERCLTQALNEDRRCDLILLTGDLVNEIDNAIYERIFAKLSATNIAFACIAGNHDVTDELYPERPFDKRQLVAQPPDSRLLTHHCIQANDWQILLVDSSIPGQVKGKLPKQTKSWLTKQLSNNHRATILVLHHHLVPVHSKWIDAHMAEGAEEIWQLLHQFDHVKAVLSGHVHQAFHTQYKGIDFYTSPSTCYQFKIGSDEFALDKFAKPGYRWLQLGNNGYLESWVKRLDT
ncbi:metallophosphoesterase [Psychrobacter sp. I-STPA10]|uniref:metallophosphoesterase n=1 Tax=Psychrobacter sp. I-STPA10 TaxID=2585769 RepID=UPI001E29A148|nr:metallophosphoesterase [Psychrobacter sp. I-STPA10]